jgi:hypothetical protein
MTQVAPHEVGEAEINFLGPSGNRLQGANLLQVGLRALRSLC